MADKKKTFTFTNENLYDRNIFADVFPNFGNALDSDSYEELFKSVQKYFFYTQHFYQDKSALISDKLITASELLDKSETVITKPQQRELIKRRQKAKVLLLQCWMDISNAMHANNYFKRSYEEHETTDEDQSSLR